MAITLDGTNGIGAPGTETFGDGTPLGGATNPVVSMAKGADSYVQGYIVNNTNDPSSSADLVAYPSNGTDAHGWVDIGITSLAYADPVYTVTGPNEAYLFGSAPTGSGATGNLVIATDNTGTANSIQFYTGGFTQAKSAAKMTINGSGAIAYGTSYGTSGQVLTSNGSAAAPTWNTLTVSGTGGATASGSVTLTSASSGAQFITPTGWGQYVALPAATTMTKAACVFTIQNNSAYDLKIKDNAGNTKGFIRGYKTAYIGLADNSTAAGTWTISNAELIGVAARTETSVAGQGSTQVVLTVDADRDFVILFDTSGVNNTYGIIYNKTTNTWGAATLIRAAAAVESKINAILSATDQVLVASTTGGVLQAVVLTLSGTSITVGTAITPTVSANTNGLGPGTIPQGFIQVGTSYILAYKDNTTSTVVRAFTISGTTVTAGAENRPTGNAYIAVYPITSTVFVACSVSASGPFYAKAYSVSGTTLTGGTEVSAGSSATDSSFFSYQTASNRVAFAVTSAAADTTAGIVTVTGTVPSISSGLLTNGANANSAAWWPTATKMTMVMINSGSIRVNSFSDNAGTVSIGTNIIISGSAAWSGQPGVWPIDANTIGANVQFSSNGTAIASLIISTSGTSPVYVSQYDTQFYWSSAGGGSINGAASGAQAVNKAGKPSALYNSSGMMLGADFTMFGAAYSQFAVNTPAGFAFTAPLPVSGLGPGTNGPGNTPNGRGIYTCSVSNNTKMGVMLMELAA